MKKMIVIENKLKSAVQVYEYKVVNDKLMYRTWFWNEHEHKQTDWDESVHESMEAAKNFFEATGDTIYTF
jgi:hypothetical protein